MDLSPSENFVSAATPGGCPAGVSPTAAGARRPRDSRRDAGVTSSRGTLLREIFYRHPLPQRPVVFGVVSPDIQPVRNSLGVQDRGKLDVLVQANVPIG